MAEEKLKCFGDLLKESLGNRTDMQESNTPATDNELNSAERAAILEKVAKSIPKAPAQPPSVGSDTSEDLSTVPFGVLLERTAKIRSELDSNDYEAEDKIREKVIEQSKMNLVEDIMKGFRF